MENIEATMPENKMSAVDTLKQQSMQVGANLLAFLDGVKVGAKTEQERQTLNVYSSTCGIAEQIANGTLVIVDAVSIQDAPTDDNATEGEE